MLKCYILIFILIYILLFKYIYDNLVKSKETFIDTVKNICNIRQKLNLEPCLKDFQGDKGLKGMVGRDGGVGEIGNKGFKGMPGKNGKNASDIGKIIFKDKITDTTINTYHLDNSVNNTITSINIPRGEAGENLLKNKMYNFLFKDRETNHILNSYNTNPNNETITVNIPRGNIGKTGNQNIRCYKRGPTGDQGLQGEPGLKGLKGNPGRNGKNGKNGKYKMDATLDNIYVKNGLCLTAEKTDLNINQDKNKCTNIPSLCILNDSENLKKIKNKIKIIRKELDYEKVINKNLSVIDTTVIDETDKDETNVEQFQNYNLNNKCVNNNQVCSLRIKGERGVTGETGETGNKGLKGISGEIGLNGFDGIDGKEIPNIVFKDTNNNIIGKYISLDKTAETITLFFDINKIEGAIGENAILPNINFVYHNNIIHRKKTTSDVYINVYLDKVKGNSGIDGSDSVCLEGKVGDPGKQGPRGPNGPKGFRGDDAKDGLDGEDSPLTNSNPYYNNVITKQICLQPDNNCLNKSLINYINEHFVKTKFLNNL